MKRTNYLSILCLLISTIGFSGCEIFGGGMNTVEPSTLSEENPPIESVLKDLTPVRSRDMMLSKRENHAPKF